jgi:hypothetical protein
MDFTSINEDRDLLVNLQQLLDEALLEEKRAILRVKRLQTQVQMVAKRCGQPWQHKNNVASNVKDIGLKKEATPDFLDTLTTSMLPPGWETAIDPISKKTYFYNSSKNVVQWTAPVFQQPRSESPASITRDTSRVNSRSNSPSGNSPDSINSLENRGEKRRQSVYERLTDHTFYTGSSKSRFGIDGKGSPNINNYEGFPNHFQGFTNTKSDELFHDSSEFLVRDDNQENGKRDQWRS